MSVVLAENEEGEFILPTPSMCSALSTGYVNLIYLVSTIPCRQGSGANPVPAENWQRIPGGLSRSEEEGELFLPIGEVSYRPESGQTA